MAEGCPALFVATISSRLYLVKRKDMVIVLTGYPTNRRDRRPFLRRPPAALPARAAGRKNNKDSTGRFENEGQEDFHPFRRGQPPEADDGRDRRTGGSCNAEGLACAGQADAGDVDPVVIQPLPC